MNLHERRCSRCVREGNDSNALTRSVDASDTWEGVLEAPKASRLCVREAIPVTGLDAKHLSTAPQTHLCCSWLNLARSRLLGLTAHGSSFTGLHYHGMRSNKPQYELKLRGYRLTRVALLRTNLALTRGETMVN